MAETMNLESKIFGWGADLDPSKRPGIPREKTAETGGGPLRQSPEQQVPHVKIHKSIERPRLSSAIGTTCPPRGLSGRIRDVAYRFSEGRISHWMLLLFADRVDMVEGVIEDLSRGHVPNIWKEMGLGAEWKYNRQNFQKKALIAGAGLAAVVGLLVLSKQRRALKS